MTTTLAIVVCLTASTKHVELVNWHRPDATTGQPSTLIWRIGPVRDPAARYTNIVSDISAPNQNTTVHPLTSAARVYSESRLTSNIPENASTSPADRSDQRQPGTPGRGIGGL